MRSAPFSLSAKTAVRARRAAVRSCASAMAFASEGDGEGAEDASFVATALAAAGFVWALD